MFDILVLGIHIICREEEDRKRKKMFVIRQFSGANFDTAANRFRICGGGFSQTPFMLVVRM